MANKQDPFQISSFGGNAYLEGKLVGGYVPRPSADYLRLLALYKNGSVQSVLQEMIDEWMKEQEPKQAIIEVLADRAYMEWIRRDLDIANWEYYEKEIISRLKKRKIDDQDIQNILKEMRTRIGKIK